MADEARAARAAALQEKKRRLEELKAQRRTRRMQEEQIGTTSSTPKNLDEYIDGLLKTATPSAPSSTADSSSIGVSSSASSQQQQNQQQLNHQTASNSSMPNDGDSSATLNNVIAEKAPEPAMPPPKKKVETFEVSTQTLPQDFPEEPPEDQEDDDDDDDKPKVPLEVLEVPENKSIASIQPTILDPTQAEAAVSRGNFAQFLHTASKKVERVLGEPLLADLLVNSVADDDAMTSDRDTSTDGANAAGTNLWTSSSTVFYEPKWASHRDVTDINWSSLKRELFVSSYNHSSANQHTSRSSAVLVRRSPHDTPSASLVPRSGDLESDGLALMWNLTMPQRPEHVFVSGAPLDRVMFHPTEAHLVMGAAHSGQLILWDVRAGRLPVQRSTLDAHTHPICGLEVIDSGVITAATDGTVNTWSLSNLREAAETQNLNANLSSMTTVPGSGASIICGDERGNIHFVPASSQSSNKKSLRTEHSGHFGMVTDVSCSHVGSDNNSITCLSTGVDWTLKLWSMENKTSTTMAAANTQQEPVWSVTSHTYDYYCAAQWNPAHPSLFCTMSTNGALGLWNLAVSLEDTIGQVSFHDKNPRGAGMNRIRWSGDGRRLLVSCGDQVHLLCLSEQAIRQSHESAAEHESVLQQLVQVQKGGG